MVIGKLYSSFVASIQIDKPSTKLDDSAEIFTTSIPLAAYSCQLDFSITPRDIGKP